MFNFAEPKFWIALAFVLLIGLSAKKITKLVASVLDDHAAKIKSELEIASKIRLEAEQTLAIYKQKQMEFTKEAELLLEKSRIDAENNAKQAQIELKEALDARLKQALEKIAQEESAAMTEVRNHVVDITLAAARNIIADQMNTISQSQLIKLAMADIERKVH